MDIKKIHVEHHHHHNHHHHDHDKRIIKIKKEDIVENVTIN